LQQDMAAKEKKALHSSSSVTEHHINMHAADLDQLQYCRLRVRQVSAKLLVTCAVQHVAITHRCTACDRHMTWHILGGANHTNNECKTVH
jgi:hypothetical protein